MVELARANQDSHILLMITHKNFFRNTGKAASDDAILFHLYQIVSTRVSKLIYGSLNPLSISHTTQITQAINPSQKAFTSSTGARRLRGSFNIFLTKVSFFFLSSKDSVCYLKTFTCRGFRRHSKYLIVLLCYRFCWFSTNVGPMSPCTIIYLASFSI